MAQRHVFSSRGALPSEEAPPKEKVLTYAVSCASSKCARGSTYGAAVAVAVAVAVVVAVAGCVCGCGCGYGLGCGSGFGCGCG